VNNYQGHAHRLMAGVLVFRYLCGSREQVRYAYFMIQHAISAFAMSEASPLSSLIAQWLLRELFLLLEAAFRPVLKLSKQLRV
jgi:hypothetical protein